MTDKPTKVTKSSKASPSWPERRDATDAQKREIGAARERKEGRRPGLPLTARMGEGNVLQVATTLTDDAGGHDRLLDVTGTRSGEWTDALTLALANVNGGKQPDEMLQQGLAFLNGICPRDETEAALGAQMFAVHVSMMQAIRRMNGADDREMYMDYVKAAGKLGGLYTKQLELLTKLRTGGKQQVVVTYADLRTQVDTGGGNAVFASMGGGVSETGPQPLGPDQLASLAFAPGVPMPSANPARDCLPIASDQGAETLPPAWWPVSGGAEGQGER